MAGKTEVWQRGPVPSIPALLQAVAHALLQALEEVNEVMQDFPEHLLWQRPAGVASVGFHLQHLTGVLDRLFSYAAKDILSPEQLHWLSAEGKEHETKASSAELVALFKKQVEESLSILSKANSTSLTEIRTVGRKKIPSTLIGLYFHAAEHTMRHLGQLYVTVKILKAENSK